MSGIILVLFGIPHNFARCLHRLIVGKRPRSKRICCPDINGCWGALNRSVIPNEGNCLSDLVVGSGSRRGREHFNATRSIHRVDLIGLGGPGCCFARLSRPLSYGT